MTDHLSSLTLNALADGELSADQLGIAKEHLDTCPSCTSNALAQALLKTATARLGQRYELPAQVQQRVERLITQHASNVDEPNLNGDRIPPSRSRKWIAFSGWATAAALLVILCSGVFVQRRTQQSEVASVSHSALITEICDQHIATLAANLPPQVLSSDRHTVKPWFQGKIPFSFNLPENLPADTKLDGANLTYLHNHPVAQLLYSIGRHHVSIFVQEKTGIDDSSPLMAEHSGFQLAGFRTADLEVIAVSDVDPTRLSELVDTIERTQSNIHRQP